MHHAMVSSLAANDHRGDHCLEKGSRNEKNDNFFYKFTLRTEGIYWENREPWSW